jgi:DNA-binding NarL/FixJ family response regulator
MRAFVVEDSAMLVERLRDILAAVGGIEFVGASGSACEAIELILGANPDVVILDIRLDSGSGIDVLRHIKANQPSIKVIVLTNYPFPQYRKKCLELGAEHFLDKVTEVEQVADILREWKGTEEK